MRHLLVFTIFTLLLPTTASARFTDFEFTEFVSRFCGILESGHALCVSAEVDSADLAPDPALTFTAIGVGEYYACGITTDADLACWGAGEEGQLSPPAFDAPVVELSVGRYHACAVDREGNLKCWGQNTQGQSEPPQPATGFRDVDVLSINTTCGVRMDGQLACWGLVNALPFPEGVDDPSRSPIVQLEHAVFVGCAVRADGTADCWRGRGADSTVIAEFRDGPYERAFPLDPNDGRSACAVTLNGEIDCVNGPPDSSFYDRFPPPFEVTRSTEMYQLTRGTGFFLMGLNFDNRIEPVDGSFGDDIQRTLDIINGDLQLETATLTDAQYYGAGGGVEIFFDVTNSNTRFRINNDIEVYRNGELITTTDSDRSYYDATAADGQQYEYTLRVVHVLGQAGDFSNAISVDTTAAGATDVLLPVADASRPYRPAGLRAEIYWFDVELFWDRNRSGNVEAYEIRKNGELVAVTRGTSWYDDSGVSGDNPQYDVLAVGSDNQLLGIDSVSLQIGPAECR